MASGFLLQVVVYVVVRGGASFSDSAFPSSAKGLSSRVKRRRSRSSASGAGLEMTLTSPNSEKSSSGVRRSFCPYLSFIALFGELE